MIIDSDRSRRIARARLAAGAFHSGPAATSLEHDAALGDVAIVLDDDFGGRDFESFAGGAVTPNV